MFDVTAIGELLIDFTPAGVSAQGRPLFEQNPGGAPANVLACLSRLGRKTAFMGKVGADQFGYSLKTSLDQAGVSTRGLVISEEYNTTLAFVLLNEPGDRSFSFYRNPGADMMLDITDLSYNLIDDCSIFHFGAVSMTDNPSREATMTAVRYAREQGKTISYDPNLRLMLWKSEAIARNTIMSALPSVDFLKISAEELEFLTGQKDLSQGSDFLMRKYDLQLILITLGPKGAYARTAVAESWHPAYDVKTIDTTGAGDAFTGSFLYQILQTGKPLPSISEEDLIGFLAFANAAGSLATAKKGAIPAMPTLAEVDECLMHTPHLR